MHELACEAHASASSAIINFKHFGGALKTCRILQAEVLVLLQRHDEAIEAHPPSALSLPNTGRVAKRGGSCEHLQSYCVQVVWRCGKRKGDPRHLGAPLGLLSSLGPQRKASLGLSGGLFLMDPKLPLEEGTTPSSTMTLTPIPVRNLAL